MMEWQGCRSGRFFRGNTRSDQCRLYHLSRERRALGKWTPGSRHFRHHARGSIPAGKSCRGDRGAECNGPNGTALRAPCTLSYPGGISRCERDCRNLGDCGPPGCPLSLFHPYQQRVPDCRMERQPTCPRRLIHQKSCSRCKIFNSHWLLIQDLTNGGKSPIGELEIYDGAYRISVQTEKGRKEYRFNAMNGLEISTL